MPNDKKIWCLWKRWLFLSYCTLLWTTERIMFILSWVFCPVYGQSCIICIFLNYNFPQKQKLVTVIEDKWQFNGNKIARQASTHWHSNLHFYSRMTTNLQGEKTLGIFNRVINNARSCWHENFIWKYFCPIWTQNLRPNDLFFFPDVLDVNPSFKAILS